MVEIKPGRRKHLFLKGQGYLVLLPGCQGYANFKVCQLRLRIFLKERKTSSERQNPLDNSFPPHFI